ncbi:TPA: hypothetical protein I8Y21_002307 [Klebsiella oxytoca]|uniref:CofB-like pilin domain-containing protein n=1 Tax=Klebsiella oxytoca TaxID=571 RepID=A0AAN5L7R5_KLEOX|nr:hypothetical protein [Klebsiella oxytoca]
MIFVLAFLGIILAGVGTYTRKMVDERARQSVADAVAEEVYGLLRFVNADNISASVDGNARTIMNPMYQQADDDVYMPPGDTPGQVQGISNNPIFISHDLSSQYHDVSLNVNSGVISPYIARVYSKHVEDPVQSDNPVSNILRWSPDIWPGHEAGNSSVRGYFTDSVCFASSGVPKVYFNQQFLPCNEAPVLRGSEIAIPRIDLVNDKGTESRDNVNNLATTVAINRVDVYVSFNPADGNPARIEQYFTPLMNAFKAKKIVPNMGAVYLVVKGGGWGKWNLLDKSGAPISDNATAANIENKIATISDLPNMIASLRKNNDKIYGLRFTFDGKGDYLRTDGLNSADKVCWSIVSGAGPCLHESGASPVDSLILKQRKNPQELADMQLRSVVLHNKVTGEYYTAPQIQYSTFSNNGDKLSPVIGGSSNGVPSSDDVMDSNSGAILIPVQTCPVADGFSQADNPGDHELYPRLSVSISSLVSGIPAEGDVVTTFKGHGFDALSKNLNPNPGDASSLGNLTINRLGGVILQVTKGKEQPSPQWHIGSMVASEGYNTSTGPDTGGGSSTLGTGGGSPDAGDRKNAWLFFNPPWLSVVVTTWCSSVPQT